MLQNVSSAVVLIEALRVNLSLSNTSNSTCDNKQLLTLVFVDNLI